MHVVDLRDVPAALGAVAVASHGTAAALWGISLVESLPPAMTVPRAQRRATAEGWRVRRADLPTSDVCLRRGARCTTPARTVLDLARELPEAHAVAALDSALHQGLVSRAALAGRISRMQGRDTLTLRRAVLLADARAESVLESLLRVLLFRAGLPRPRSQYVVRDDERVLRLDLAWPELRLAVEADGFEYHSDRRAYRRDRRRLNALTAPGLARPALRLGGRGRRARPCGADGSLPGRLTSVRACR